MLGSKSSNRINFAKLYILKTGTPMKKLLIGTFMKGERTDDNTEISEPVKGNKAIIIPITMGNLRITNLIIFDKNRKILFKQKL